MRSVVTILVVCGASATCLGGLHYTVIALSADGAPVPAAEDIDNAGNVLALDQHFKPVLLTPDGKTNPLTSSNGLPVPASALNDHGMLTGDTLVSQNQGIVTGIWKDGTVTALASPPKSDIDFVSQGDDINNDGLVAGMVRSAGALHAALWDQSGLHQLPDSGRSFANGMNNAGDVVGEDQPSDTSGALNGTSFAALWQNGQLTHLQIPNSQNTFATAINDHPAIVGGAGFGDTVRGFVFSDGIVRWLQPLPGQSSSYAFRINNEGMVLGGANGLGAPILWTSDGTPIDLLKFFPAQQHWTEVNVRAINDSGWIIGEAEMHGQFRAFEMRPSVIPLPSALPASLTLLPLLAVAHGRRRVRASYSSD